MSHKVDYRETLVTYLRSETIEDAATQLHVSKTVLASRLAIMRAAGVKVPKKVRRALDSLEVAQLNSLIKQHSK